MARLRALRRVLAGAQPPKPVKISATVKAAPVVQESTKPRYPEPINYSQHSQQLYDRFEQNVAENKPHFLIGGKEVYFPWSPVTLLPPSAKMTPYQAQFQVPRTFNKLDFRDYLWHVYKLRALNITTQIKWSQWHRQGPSRYRTPQVKKMIIEMEQPFLWPKSSEEIEEHHQKSSNLEFTKYEEEMTDRVGSDMKKPAKAFDGVLGPYPEAPKPFVPKLLRTQMANLKSKAEKNEKTRQESESIRRFLKL